MFFLLLGFIALISFLVLIVKFFINMIRKRPYKKNFLFAFGALFLFVFSICMLPDVESSNNVTNTALDPPKESESNPPKSSGDNVNTQNSTPSSGNDTAETRKPVEQVEPPKTEEPSNDSVNVPALPSSSDTGTADNDTASTDIAAEPAATEQKMNSMFG